MGLFERLFAAFCVTLVGVAFWPAIALADGGSGTSWQTYVIGGVLSLAAGVVATALVKALKVVAKKFNIEIDREKEAQLHEAARAAILWVAERAAVAEKAGKKLPSSEKLKLATGRLLAKAPNVTEAEAVELVETNLGQVGEGAAKSFNGLARAMASMSRGPADVE